MAKKIDDQSVLGHIDALVKEEERLYAQQELSDDDRGRLAKIKVGIYCGNDARFANSDEIPIKPSFGPRILSKSINSSHQLLYGSRPHSTC